MNETCMWCSKDSDSVINGICDDCNNENKPKPRDIRGRIYWDGMGFKKGIETDHTGKFLYYLDLTGIDADSLKNLYYNCTAMQAAFSDIIEDAIDARIGVLEEQAMECRFNRPEL